MELQFGMMLFVTRKHEGQICFSGRWERLRWMQALCRNQAFEAANWMFALLMAFMLGACSVPSPARTDFGQQPDACQRLLQAMGSNDPEAWQPWGDLQLPVEWMSKAFRPSEGARPGTWPAFACRDSLMQAPVAGLGMFRQWADDLQKRGERQENDAVPVLPLLRWQACSAGLQAACGLGCPGPQVSAQAAAQVGEVLNSLPDESLRQLLRPLVEQLARAHEQVQKNLPQDLSVDELMAVLLPLIQPSHDAPVTSEELVRLRHLMEQVDVDQLACDSMALTQAVQQAVTGLRRLQQQGDLPALHWQADSPWGVLALDTRDEDGLWQVEDQALLIDLGGHDRYVFTATSRHVPVMVLIDLDGDDRYESVSAGAGPAAALLGLRVLWDAAGDDEYDNRGQIMGQGAAVLGAAVLVDEAGDDVYRAAVAAQAWALGGLALLLDAEGDDIYQASSLAQGSAQPGGVALLADLAGNDHYQLDAAPLLRPSAQLPDRNSSLGQGAASGWWLPDQVEASVPGGLGVLFDAGGNDHYQAQVFAQGAGYYLGTGLLLDAGGHDRFEAAWYAMGAAAHLGQGLLLKRGQGDDRYHVSHVSALGMGHDQALGMMVDEGGNDDYVAGGLAFGTGHDGGVGVMMDFGGDNRFRQRGRDCRAFGAAVAAGDDLSAQGLFVARGRRNRYTLPPGSDCVPIGPGRRWFWPRDESAGERGFGMDVTEQP